MIKDLPPVSQMMRDAGLEPKKQFGQNFLFDLNLTRKIAAAVPGIKGALIVEIGPGPGGLTRAILESGAWHLIAIEKDRTAREILEKISSAADGKLEVIFDDALKFDYTKLSNYHICANLPYNVGTELLIKWLHLVANGNGPKSLTLMFQREVAQRIVARVGDEHYGRLSVLTSLLADAKILFNVPNTAFYPAPKVQSAVVQIIPKSDIIKNIDSVEKITAKLFGNRRKMIRGIMPEINWEEFGLTGRERAEELSPGQFRDLATRREK